MNKWLLIGLIAVGVILLASFAYLLYKKFSSTGSTGSVEDVGQTTTDNTGNVLCEEPPNEAKMTLGDPAVHSWSALLQYGVYVFKDKKLKKFQTVKQWTDAGYGSANEMIKVDSLYIKCLKDKYGETIF